MQVYLLVAVIAAGGSMASPNIKRVPVASLEKCLELSATMVRNNQPRVGVEIEGFGAGCIVVKQ